MIRQFKGSPKIYILVVAVIIFNSCNPQGIRRSRMQGEETMAKPDSFLYYQPMALNDSFLDSLKIENDKEQSLKVRLIPPPPPPAPKTKRVEGFRVQTFAGLDSINALYLVERLKDTVKDSIYFFKENNLYKIQFGDYLYRNDADLKVMDIRKFGINGAWVVARMINVPIIADSSGSIIPADTVASVKDAPFKIQVLVTSDLQKAKNLTGHLKNQFERQSYFITSGQLYKIFLGKFTDRADAEKVLAEVKNAGYKDAWLVYKK
jgi:sporulation related protein